MSSELIDREIIVFDGGNPHTPPIKPPNGVNWQSLSVRLLHIQDNIQPNTGLTAPRMGYDIYPFIRLPRQMSLDIIGEIVNSLLACKTLQRMTLRRDDHKRVFTDYGKPVRYTCVGLQPSRNSKIVRPHPPFMQSLPKCHWRSLLWLMKRAKISFRTIADSRGVISYLDHAKKLVHYQTFKSGSSTDNHSKFNTEFFGGIGFGTTIVFLRCHTDTDFTMSILQVFLKGKVKYSLDNNVIVYFCFPTIGLAVPLRPGDYLLFNAHIPHCLSSRCKYEYEDEIITTSTYLKAAIVGMNNNDLPLTTNQAQMLYQLKCSFVLSNSITKITTPISPWQNNQIRVTVPSKIRYNT